MSLALSTCHIAIGYGTTTTDSKMQCIWVKHLVWRSGDIVYTFMNLKKRSKSYVFTSYFKLVHRFQDGSDSLPPCWFARARSLHAEVLDTFHGSIDDRTIKLWMLLVHRL